MMPHQALFHLDSRMNIDHRVRSSNYYAEDEFEESGENEHLICIFLRQGRMIIFTSLIEEKYLQNALIRQ
jgi:hypothetical protein